MIVAGPIAGARQCITQVLPAAGDTGSATAGARPDEFAMVHRVGTTFVSKSGQQRTIRAKVGACHARLRPALSPTWQEQQSAQSGCHACCGNAKPVQKLPARYARRRLLGHSTDLLKHGPPLLKQQWKLRSHCSRFHWLPVHDDRGPADCRRPSVHNPGTAGCWRCLWT